MTRVGGVDSDGLLWLFRSPVGVRKWQVCGGDRRAAQVGAGDEMRRWGIPAVRMWLLSLLRCS